jgi:hypothetical protein
VAYAIKTKGGIWVGIILMILTFSGIPFLLIQLAPGKKSFALLTLGYIGIMAYGYHFITNLDENVDGPGGMFVILFFFLMCLGAIAGIITKAITLYMAFKGFSFKKRMIARFVGLLLIPIFVYTLIVLEKWKNRAPSTACNYDLITFSIAGEKFQLPSIGIINAMRGDGKPKLNDKDFFAFVGPKSLRKFCAEFNNGQTPAEVNAVSLNLSNIPREKMDKRFTILCSKAKWPKEVCNYTGYNAPIGYPDKIGLYDKRKFNPGFMGGGWDYKRISKEFVNATQPSDIPEFAFDGHNYLWIDKSANKSDAIPFTLNCFKSSDALYCQTDEKWKGDVYVNYGALVSIENPISDARKIRETTINFLKIIEQQN